MTIQEYKKKRNTILLFSILAIVIGAIFTTFLPNQIGLALIIAGAVGLTIVLPRLNFQFKLAYVKSAFKKHDLDFYCAMNNRLPETFSYNLHENDFINSHFVHKVNNCCYNTNDLVVGKRNDVCFRSVAVKYFTKKTKRKYGTVYFDGRVYAFALDFENFTFVMKENEEIKDNHLEKVEFESITFNEKFHCYTDNVHEAFYYIKPHTLEKITELEKEFNGQLFLSISRGVLYVGKDDFHAFELKKITNDESLNKEIEDEIKFIDDIIDCFKKTN